MDSSFDYKCSLCLLKCIDHLYIFGDQGRRLKIADIISQHFWFKVEENDKFPKIVCTTCWWKIENFHIFYQNIYTVLNNTPAEKLSMQITEHNDSKAENMDNCIEMKTQNHLQDFYDEQFLEQQQNTTLQETSTHFNKIFNKIENIKKDIGIDNDYCCKLYKSGSFDDKIEEKDIKLSLSNGKKEKVSNAITIFKKRNSLEAQEEDERIREYFKMECDFCSTRFVRFPDVKVHYRDIHQLNGYVSCCNKKFFRRIRVLEHIMRHLDPEFFKCKICNKVYADKPGLLHHMDGHAPSKDKKFKCEKCPKEFKKKFQLDQHQIRHISEEEKRFFCDECGKAYATKSILQSHIRGVHEGAYVHLCDICSKVFKSKMCFEIHRMEHTNIEPTKVQCQICGKYLKNHHSLRSHMARHEDANITHICKICGKIAPNRGALRSHIKFVHIIEKKFKCSICEKAFKKSISLKEHMTLHTGEILYTCQYCPKTFNSAANLHSHTKKMHTKEWEESRKNKI